MEESILHYIRPKAPFLWVDGADRLPNIYYLFRAEFTVEEDDNPSSLWICARKKYRLYINDKLIGQGLPPAVEYGNIIDCHAVARELLPGSKNCLAVEVHDMEGSGEACFIAWLENADGTLYMGLSEKDIQVLPAPMWERNTQEDRQNSNVRYQEHYDARSCPFGWRLPGKLRKCCL